MHLGTSLQFWSQLDVCVTYQCYFAFAGKFGLVPELMAQQEQCTPLCLVTALCIVSV